MKQLLLLCVLMGLSVPIAAQQQKENKTDKSNAAGQTTETAAQPLKAGMTPAELAQAALKAHGGDKLKNLQTLILRGTVDVTSSAFSQGLSGGFATVFKGDKYRLQISSPFFNFVQTFDGENTSSSVGGVNIPPVNRLGLPLLAKINESGYVVSESSDKKKAFSFRITSPEGYATDFTLDSKTGQVKGYSAQYETNGRQITTAVEHDTFRTVEGVLLAEKYSQRFDAGQQTFYAAFKTKEMLVNSEVAEDVFVIQ